MIALKILVVSFLLLSPILQLVCAEDGNSHGQRRDEDDPRFDARISELLAKNMVQLSQEIGTTILQDSDKASEVFSPLSIYTTLSILLMGANGHTFQELMNLLKINNDPYLAQNTWRVHEELSIMIDDLKQNISNPSRLRHQVSWKTQKNAQNIISNRETLQEISIANGIFFQNGYSVRDDYKSAIESAYKSTLQRLDFVHKAGLSTKYINRWVEEKTNGKIKNIILDTLPSSTKSVIASTLYFKALWERSFLEEATKMREFYPNGWNEIPIKVETMITGGSYPFYDAIEHDCRIIGLPYRKHLTTMYIILPNNSTRHRLRQLQATLTADKIQGIISKMEWRTAIVQMPKFHITNKINLKIILSRMGLRSLFDDDQSDLSLISTGFEDISSLNRIGEDDIIGMNDNASNVTSKTASSANNSLNNMPKRKRRSAVTYKAVSSDANAQREPLRLKDLVIDKRITKSYPHKKLLSRSRREVPVDPSVSLKRLDLLRTRLNSEHSPNPRLYADELIHQVDLTVNEIGTEGGAGTISTLRRSGPDVYFRVETPFLFLITHEDTKLPIFYGAVFEPKNN